MNNQPSQDSLKTLECLRQAVAKALERKRLLNQYAVVWEDGKPAIIGNMSEAEKAKILGRFDAKPEASSGSGNK